MPVDSLINYYLALFAFVKWTVLYTYHMQLNMDEHCMHMIIFEISLIKIAAYLNFIIFILKLS